MLFDFLSWREALLTNDGQHYYKAADMLKNAGLEYRLKVKSMNRGSTRRGTCVGINPQYMYSYQIYVKKPQLEQAKFVCRGGKQRRNNRSGRRCAPPAAFVKAGETFNYLRKNPSGKPEGFFVLTA